MFTPAVHLKQFCQKMLLTVFQPRLVGVRPRQPRNKPPLRLRQRAPQWLHTQVQPTPGKWNLLHVSTMPAHRLIPRKEISVQAPLSLPTLAVLVYTSTMHGFKAD
jgi:hypothetical protein